MYFVIDITFLGEILSQKIRKSKRIRFNDFKIKKNVYKGIMCILIKEDKQQLFECKIKGILN